MKLRLITFIYISLVALINVLIIGTCELSNKYMQWEDKVYL